MRVILVKRGKVIHCGIQAKSDGELYKISVCNGRWDLTDKTSIGNAEEVTCKRCQKIIARADKNGCVNL